MFFNPLAPLPKAKRETRQVLKGLPVFLWTGLILYLRSAFTAAKRTAIKRRELTTRADMIFTCFIKLMF
jgi:hypothetical protein